MFVPQAEIGVEREILRVVSLFVAFRGASALPNVKSFGTLPARPS
jgi:hypothetical protein